jgi:hypothetical protein
MRLRLGSGETGPSLTRDSIRIAVNPFGTRSVDAPINRRGLSI